jgi:sulfur-carrier protein
VSPFPEDTAVSGPRGSPTGEPATDSGAMARVRVTLPAHLQTLAGVGGEVLVEVKGAPTLPGVLDALEDAFPVLRGTIRPHGREGRRPLLRFYAGGRDLTHDPADRLLPEDVATGREPVQVVGAIAGG